MIEAAIHNFKRKVVVQLHCKMDLMTMTLEEYLHRISLLIYLWTFLFIKLYLKLTPVLQKKIAILVLSCRAAVWQNNSQCLLLKILINAKRDIFQFVRNENTKNEHVGIKRKKNWRKSKRNSAISSNIYINSGII